jgi:putative nucleotidyltransferase with HDIG domain
VWEHSVVVGLIARDVAALVGNAEPDSCYLAGLLHDIGKPVMGAMLLEVERSTSRNGSAFISSAQWTAIVDRTHRRVGVAVASEWKLADSITSAIRDCSDYDAADRASAANIVRFSNALAKREGFGTGTVDMSDVEALVMVGKSMLGADETIVNRLVANVRPRLQQAK